MQHIPLHHMHRARCNMHQATRNTQHHSRHSRTKTYRGVVEVPEHCADELALRRARRSAAPLRVRQRHKPVLVRYNTHAGPLQRARRARRAARPVHALKRASPALCRAGPGLCRKDAGERSPGADVAGVGPVPARMWAASGERSPGADVAGPRHRVKGCRAVGGGVLERVQLLRDLGCDLRANRTE